MSTKSHAHTRCGTLRKSSISTRGYRVVTLDVLRENRVQKTSIGRVRPHIRDGRPLTDGHSTCRSGLRSASRRTERPSAFQPSVGAGDQQSDGRPPCRPPKPTAEWSGGQHAIRRTSMDCRARSDVRTRDNPEGVCSNSQSKAIF
jgi:hypothetical protein